MNLILKQRPPVIPQLLIFLMLLCPLLNLGRTVMLFLKTIYFRFSFLLSFFLFFCGILDFTMFFSFPTSVPFFILILQMMFFSCSCTVEPTRNYLTWDNSFLQWFRWLWSFHFLSDFMVFVLEFEFRRCFSNNIILQHTKSNSLPCVMCCMGQVFWEEY